MQSTLFFSGIFWHMRKDLGFVCSHVLPFQSPQRMLFVYTNQGGAVKYEKNSGGTLDFQRTPDVMCLASEAGKGRERNMFPFKISLIQIPLLAPFAEHEANQS